MRQTVDVRGRVGREVSARYRLAGRATAITGIRVYDVGQGDCIGLLDQNGEVCLYVDYGGYLDHPDSTRPAGAAPRMPTQTKRGRIGILVTHWDQDHVYSAHRYNTDAQDGPWLVPRQWVSPFAARLAAKVKRAQCWPEHKGQAAHRFVVGGRHVIEVCKCRPFDRLKPKEDRNLSGLAVTILEVRGDRVLRQIVLPGDCPFDLIPTLPRVPIRHLVAYHHGAETHWTAKTAAVLGLWKGPQSMSYSYSPLNTYGHPAWRKYRPVWHRNSVRTPNVRRAGQEFADFLW